MVVSQKLGVVVQARGEESDLKVKLYLKVSGRIWFVRDDRSVP